MTRPSLHLDFETKSTVNLRALGVYRYALHPSTSPLCAAFAFGDEPVQLWLPTDPCPPSIAEHIEAGGEIAAWNANFERLCLWAVLTPRYGWPKPKLEQFRCVMIQSLAMGLPGSLENGAAALGLTEQKDGAGFRIMQQLSQPRSVNPDGTVVWWDDPEKLEKLYAYCKQDVEVERLADKRLVHLSPSEKRLWHLDQRINDRGVFVDRQLCIQAKRVAGAATERLNARMLKATDGAVFKCSEVGRLTEWLGTRGVNTASVGKDRLEELLSWSTLPADARDALEARQEAAKASVAKLDAFLLRANDDGRCRGNLQYHGAHTGRWAARGIQLQNLPRIPDFIGPQIPGMVDALRTGDVDVVEMLYDQPMTAISLCLRSVVLAPPGKKIVSGDFANIEGRVLAWLAGEQWKLDAFRAFDAGAGPDIYKLTYARSFGLPIEQVTGDLRQIGKVEELALGFQGGVGAFQSMAKIYRVKLSDKRADEIKVAWRETHPATKQHWRDTEDAAIAAVANPGKVYRVGTSAILYRMAGSFLWCQLPSGRVLCYPYPRLKDERTPWGEMRPKLYYKRVDPYTKQWGETDTYGGSLVENNVQGTARDIMVEGMVRAEAAGYWMVLTVHDEAVAEVPKDFGSAAEFTALLAKPPAWTNGALPIAVKSWQGDRYVKALAD